MSIWLRRWRHKNSPAARRGREAHRQYTAWVEKQQALRQHSATVADDKT